MALDLLRRKRVKGPEEGRKNIARLTELTANLKDYRMIPRVLSDAHIFNLDMDTGGAILTGLHKDGLSGVILCETEAGTEWPEHYHDEWECVAVIEGELHIYLDGKPHIIGPKKCFSWDASILHSAYFPIDTRNYAITIPASDGFPPGPS